MRSDMDGMFWNDTPPPKPPPKEKPKTVPPERTWERPDYLPGLEQALAFDCPQFTDQQLIAASIARTEMVYDCEVYPNYFLAAFAEYHTGRVTYVEGTPGKPLDCVKLRWLVDNFSHVGFNSLDYDAAMLAMACAGRSTQEIKTASDALIMYGEAPRDVLHRYKVKPLKFDHIDLIEVAPLRASLKIYGGRLHTPRMQDLPFPPGTVLSEQQMAIVRWYCVNDLRHTALLRHCLSEQLALRTRLGEKYRLELRSKSDAQIAEAVIAEELERINQRRPTRPDIPVGTAYRYRVPDFLKYRTPLMRAVLQRVRDAWFIVNEHGKVQSPPELKGFELVMGTATYRMGIGGLHSCESCQAIAPPDGWLISDRDVTSYYPAIILLQSLFPQHLGPSFLHVYRSIVESRIAAKKAKRKSEANSLKIVVNGSFGKLGSKWSIMYAPDLMLQVTLTGQLVVLMLIERLELAGFKVVSANTDGISILFPQERKPELDALVKEWEQDVGADTEEVLYRALYSRDVNNYIGIKTDGKTKKKGVFANPWRDAEDGADKLHKNPTTTICSEAVEALLVKGTPLEATIQGCQDITKFVEVRTVKGGAVKDGVYLGKAIRWYYAAGETGTIINAATGGKVPRSAGARPLMELPAALPSDIDYQCYIDKSIDMLKSLGYLQGGMVDDGEDDSD